MVPKRLGVAAAHSDSDQDGDDGDDDEKEKNAKQVNTGKEEGFGTLECIVT